MASNLHVNIAHKNQLDKPLHQLHRHSPDTGWTFRTGIIDPEKYPKLLIEFEAFLESYTKVIRSVVLFFPLFFC